MALLCAFLAAACVPAVQAQVPSDAPSDTARVQWRTALPPLTVTATRIPAAPAESPARVTVLDSAALAQTGATSVAELLEERAGLHIRQYGAGGLASMSLRGTGASQTTVLLDGRRIGDPQLGQLDLSLLPTILLRSVDVMHGPASPLYGSDGIGGAVHLHTLRPRSSLHLKASGHRGAFGARGGSVLASGGTHRTSVVAAAEYRRSEGDFPYLNRALFPTRTVRRRNADRRRLSTYAAVRSRMGSHQLRIAGWLTDAERGLPTPGSTAPSRARQWDTQLRLWADDTIQRPWGTLSVGGLAQRNRLRYADPTQALDQTGRNWLTSVEAEAQVPVTDHWLVAGGLSGSVAWARHPSLQGGAREQHAAAFISAVATYGPVRLYPALRADTYWMPDGRRRVPLSPRLGVNVQPISAWPSLRWKAQVGRAFRTPTLNDRYWQPGGTPDLRPEHGWSADAGLLWAGDRLRAEVTTFANWRTDQIVWRPTGEGYWSPSNRSRVRALGIEASADHTWRLPLRLALQTGLGYTLTDARDRSAPGTPSYDQPLRYVPRHEAKAHATLSRGPLALDLNVRHTGRRYVTSDGSEALSPYTLVDLQLRLGYRFGAVRTDAALAIDNALNTDYRVAGQRPMPPRHTELRLTLSY